MAAAGPENKASTAGTSSESCGTPARAANGLVIVSVAIFFKGHPSATFLLRRRGCAHQQERQCYRDRRVRQVLQQLLKHGSTPRWLATQHPNDDTEACSMMPLKPDANLTPPFCKG